MTEHRVVAGQTMVLTRDQWRRLTARMRGEHNTSVWILHRDWIAPGTEGKCMALSLRGSDTATLAIFLAHLIEVTSVEGQDDVPTAMEDLRHLASQVRTIRLEDDQYRLHYLPCVTVERSQA